ncbi:hypothetical protein C6V83_00140 [Gordonia iterans]|uniref:IrrE N-terminal-like domain-containing protein n=1 Tax=Gordonia iterans TaxID=1004901 RepID=A0A2S0KB69_9ACTN|nr:hypothetical protein [Gordonia iterans]AVL98926.1 hypothetical protein C6V83_00140 [Gordonia iterans]
MSRHHPWRALRDHLPHVDITWQRIAGAVCGYWDGANRIVMDPRATQAERRSTLAHEMAHIERGVIPLDPVLAAREEATVDEIAARALITLDQLVDALRWCRGATSECADEVWTDRHTLAVRMNTLTPAERNYITGRLADCDWAA